MKNHKAQTAVVSSELVSLHREWLRQAKQYRFGKRWMCNDPESKKLREAKAEAIVNCASSLRAVMKAG